MSEQRSREYLKTLEDGLSAATDLLLQNSSDLAEVRELIYGHYRQEDEKRAACDAQRRDMRDRMADVVSSTIRYHEPRDRTSEPTDGQLRRLLQELRALQQAKADSMIQFIDDYKAMQEHHHYQIMASIENMRSRARAPRR